MTAEPRRIQRRRTSGWRAPLDHLGRPPVYVGRGTRWGNPWAVIEIPNGWAAKWTSGPGPTPGPERCWLSTHTQLAARATATELYAEWVAVRPELLAAAREQLAGRDLMCWCPLPGPGQPDHCHAAYLLSIANSTTGDPR